MAEENKQTKQIPPGQGSLYYIDNRLNPQKKISSVSISNGLAWNSQDDTFYYIDSPTRQVVAYNYNPYSGEICKWPYYI